LRRKRQALRDTDNNRIAQKVRVRRSASSLVKSNQTLNLVRTKTKCITLSAIQISWASIAMRSRTQSGLISLDRDQPRVEHTSLETSASAESRSNTERLV
jgi:hypothetical protein